MAFKRSAVRFRLSPPKNFEIFGFRSFYLYFCNKKFCFSPIGFEGRNFLIHEIPTFDLDQPGAILYFAEKALVNADWSE